MEIERFRHSPAGRLLQQGQGETAYWAFVPNPLPPKWELDRACILALSNAAGAVGELAGLGRNLANPYLLIGPLLRREAVLSSRIEGTQAGVAELYAYEARQLALPGVRVRADEADVREVENHVQALEYGLQRVKALPVSVRLIRELHQRLLKGVRGGALTPGELRGTQNWIGGPGCTLNQASYVPPPVPQMHEALGALETYLHARDNHPPLVRLAFIHYQFEAIHPFLDGNGRLGRSLTSLLLVDWQVLPLPLLYLSAFFQRHQQEYYDLLLGVSRDGAWSQWMAFFLRCVAEEARDANARARQLQDLQVEWHGKLMSAPRTSAGMLRLVDELFLSPVITARRVQDVVGVTHRAAMGMIDRLVSQHILESSPGRKRSMQFVARDVLRVVTLDSSERE